MKRTPRSTMRRAQKALSSEILGSRTIDAVETLDVFDSSRGPPLREPRPASCRQVRRKRSAAKLVLSWRVERCPSFCSKVIKQSALIGTVHAMGVFQIENRVALGAQNRPLITGWHVAAGPVFAPLIGPPVLSNITTYPGRFSFTLPKP